MQPMRERETEASSSTVSAYARLVPSEGKGGRRQVQKNPTTDPPALSAKWSVSADTRRVGAVRREASTQVDTWGLTDLADSVGLLLTELLTNAIQHTNGARVETELSYSDGILEIEVSDLGNGRARLKKPDEQQENGRGLMIVDSLALDWGTRPRSGKKGKTTWCTLKAVQAESSPSVQGNASAPSHDERTSEPAPRAALSLARRLRHGAQRLRSRFSGPATFSGIEGKLPDATTKVVTAA